MRLNDTEKETYTHTQTHTFGSLTHTRLINTALVAFVSELPSAAPSYWQLVAAEKAAEGA